MDWQTRRYSLDKDSIEIDLSDMDEAILDCLTYRPCTPCVIQRRLASIGNEKSRQYISNRLSRLSEHGIVENLYECGQYELVES